MTIRWLAEAVDEVDAPTGFYQEKQAGLEQRFLEVLESASGESNDVRRSTKLSGEKFEGANCPVSPTA